MAMSLPRQFHPLKVNSRTGEPYLQLPAPLDNIIITPNRLSDAQVSIQFLNDPRVYKMLIGPPFPYLPIHAEEWMAKCIESSDAIFETLKTAETGNSGETEATLIHVDGCPVRALREVQPDGTDVFIGDIGIIRSGRFEYLRDKGKEKTLTEYNASLPAGNPEIIWDIGYYLAPAHHGKGIMSTALRTIIHSWAIPRMNVHVIRGSAFSGNPGSVKVFIKNGFRDFDLVEECVKLPEIKGGDVFGLHFLEWRRPVPDV